MKAKRPLRIEGDVAYVPLTRGYEAVIDAADAAQVGANNWYALSACKKVYAARAVARDGKQRVVLMHREITGAADDLEVDHEDNDGLNNRRGNLRPCTHRQNMANQVVTSRNRLGLKGASPRGDKFEACIHAGDRRYRLGCYDTPEEAAAAYHGAATVLHGEFATGAAKKTLPP